MENICSHCTTVVAIAISILFNINLVKCMSQNFVNSSSQLRPTFVVNFDLSSVICQETANHDDLKIFPISILCDGKKDCFENPGMDDESFPYCSQKCKFQCGPNGTCLMDGGRSLCYCNEGYSGKRCDKPTLNECSNKPCHWLARCTNTFDSHYCTCLPGFEGDGYNCTDIDECGAVGSSRCPANAKCCNIPGSFFCNCTEGFRPKGSPLSACTDIDECAEGKASCPANTTCVNTPGSYECSLQRCKPGYKLQNGVCTDIDECKESYIYGCDPRALCTNTDGAFKCSCPAGFSGDGKTCSPLVDCTIQPSVCHKNAYCAKEMKACVCRSGYIGDGLKCYDMNECSVDQQTCGIDEKCLNLEGSYACCHKNQSLAECKDDKGLVCEPQCAINAECKFSKCQCNSGFVGDPLHGCMDFNECASNATICPLNSWCVNLDGSFRCCDSNSKLSDCQGLLLARFPDVNKNTSNTTNNEVESFSSSIAQTSESSTQAGKQGIIIGVFPEDPVASTFSSETTLMDSSSDSPSSILSTASSSSGGQTRTEFSNSTVSLNTTAMSQVTASVSNETTEECDDITEIAVLNSSSTASTINYTSSTFPTSEIAQANTTCEDETEVTVQTATDSENATSGEGLIIGIFGSSSSLSSQTLTPNSSPLAQKTTSEDNTSPTPDTLTSTEKSTSFKTTSDSAKTTTILTTSPTSRTQASNLSTASTTPLNNSDVDRTTSGTIPFSKLTILTPVVPIHNGTTARDAGNTTAPLNYTALSSLSAVETSSGPVLTSTRTTVVKTSPTFESSTSTKEFTTTVSIELTTISTAAPTSTFANTNLSCSLERTKFCQLRRKNCIIRNGETRCTGCIEGYFENENGVCVESICCSNATDCDINANCVDLKPYGHSCTCKPGFIGDGHKCDDVDECYIPNTCSPNATCKNTKGSFTCTCKQGFFGDGQKCTVSPNNCLVNPSVCHKYARCVKSRCCCKKGFVGNGTFCTPLFEASTAPPSNYTPIYGCTFNPFLCDPNADCSANRCLCRSGFFGDGLLCFPYRQNCSLDSSICLLGQRCLEGKCQPYDCLASGLNDCPANSRCLEHRCQCIQGFYSRGPVCLPILAGTTPSLVDDDSTKKPNQEDNCESSLGSCHKQANCRENRCVCNEGFVGNGRVCLEDPNDCLAVPTLCHPNAICLGRRNCSCQPGYVGNGRDTCVLLSTIIGADQTSAKPVDDNNKTIQTTIPTGVTISSSPEPADCHSEPGQCHSMAECTREGRCVCPSGFVGDGTWCAINTTDCSVVPMICNINATCLEKKCRCLPGFIGDGFLCYPAHESDCRLSAAVCHANALCLDGSCHCSEGFTGDGIVCELAASQLSSSSSTPAQSASSTRSASSQSTHDLTSSSGQSSLSSSAATSDSSSSQSSPTSDAATFGKSSTSSSSSSLSGHSSSTSIVATSDSSSASPSGQSSSASVVATADSSSTSAVASSKSTKALDDSKSSSTSLLLSSTSLKSDQSESASPTVPISITLVATSTTAAAQRRRCTENGARVCHPQARCVGGYCVCKFGYKGDGCASCVRVDDHSDDCFVNPDLCDDNASCFRRQCQCNFDYIGDGITCRPKSHETSASNFDSSKSTSHESSSFFVSNSATTSTSHNSTSRPLLTTNEISQKPIITSCTSQFATTCSKNAECTINSGKEECRCYSGFSGDGKSCDDMNECTMRIAKCLAVATCVNTLGSYMCVCPSGQSGDGINYCNKALSDTEPLDVQCEKDGITLLLNKTSFVGKMFVKGQHSNPACSRNYTLGDAPVYKFKALFADCDVKMEDHNTFSTVVVVQRHPLFITQGDEAFKLRCTYPAGDVMLMSHYNVSMLSTADTLLRDGATPQCLLSVTSVSTGRSVAEATVGEQLQLKLSVAPKDTFGLIAKNCVALNMESGERYQLTGADGCAVDPIVFPQWRQESKSDLSANFLTFKWPDTAQIRFQCDCSPCVHECEPVTCNGEKSYGRRKKRYAFVDSALENQVFSTVLLVKNLDATLATDENRYEELINSSEESVPEQIRDDICINTGLLAAALALAMCLASTMTGGLIWACRRRQMFIKESSDHKFIRSGSDQLFTSYTPSSTLNDVRTRPKYSSSNFAFSNRCCTATKDDA